MPSQVFRFADGDVVTTDIDRRYCSREVPMRVLALGLCRTGTLCMKYPLNIFSGKRAPNKQLLR
jgi:hypothetical protein